MGKNSCYHPLLQFNNFFSFLHPYRFAYALQNTAEISKQIFLEMKLHVLSPNSYIHVSASYFYIPTIDLPILLQENRWTDRGNL
jgi:hypothetical protein